MDSLFSTVLLKAICTAQLKPVLVIDGISHPPNRRSSIVTPYSVKPKGFEAIKYFFGLKKKHEPSDISTEANLVQAAHEYGIDSLVSSDCNALRTRARLQSVEADIFVIAGFPQLLKPSVLSLVQKGGLNVHPGKLPEQRGPAPLFWALKNGDSALNYTIHVVDEGEDTGDVVSSGSFSFEPGTPGRNLLQQCGLEAAPHLVRAVRGLWDGDLVRTRQTRIKAGRCPRPKYRDNLIDASMTAEQVFSFVGGCAGAYPIFAECGGDRFFIKNAASYSIENSLPCEFMLTGDRLLLRCHPGVVELTLRPKGGAVFSGEYIEHKKEP